MKLLPFIILMLALNFSNAQTFPELEKTLEKELTKSSTRDGRWVFYSEDANIQKVEKPIVKTIIPEYEFYKVTLTNYLGYHVNKGDCLILYNGKKSKIILVEPLWYGEIDKQLIKLFMKHTFKNTEAILSFFNELNELMEIGSSYKFVGTNVSKDSINYDLTYAKGDSYKTEGNGAVSIVNYNRNGIWRKITIEIENLKIKKYISFNPAANEKNIIK